MKQQINVLEPFLDFDGEPLKAEKDRPVTLRRIIMTLNNSQHPLITENTAELYALAIRCCDPGVTEESPMVVLEDADREMIRKIVKAIYPPIYYGRVQDLLKDPSEKPKKAAPPS